MKFFVVAVVALVDAVTAFVVVSVPRNCEVSANLTVTVK